CGGALTAMLGGCSGGAGGPEYKLAEAGGTVTLSGRPLPDATVTFIPDQGPVAIGVSDLNGKFKLKTGARPGAVIGKCQVTVQSSTGGGIDPASDPSKAPATPEEAEARTKKMMEMQRNIASGGQGAAEVLSPKSAIPEKYGKPE